jgi:3-(3-hydroxy-phenyl)propionate hydroxylase
MITKSKEILPVVVVGAGPVGLAMALELALQQIPVVLIDKKNEIGKGSRAVCFAKKTLEIFAKHGVLEKILTKAEAWKTLYIYQKDKLIFTHHYQDDTASVPAYANLQQYYLEEYLKESVKNSSAINFLEGYELIDITANEEKNILLVKHEGRLKEIFAKYVIAADGVNSFVRQKLNIGFKGKFFPEKFLIIDAKINLDKASARYFWFDPSFHPGKTVLMLKQPDNIWRIDFQLDPNADEKFELQPERLHARLQRMLGEEIEFNIQWSSIYNFRCRKAERFREKNVFLIGDAAHQVSPFGARGANSGIQDAENLAWKLAWVLRNQADEALLESYAQERMPAADENILHSTRSTEFITPKTLAAKQYQLAILDLARQHPFLASFINSGRLSTPTLYKESNLWLSKASIQFSDLRGSLFENLVITKSQKNYWLFDLINHQKLTLLTINVDIKKIQNIVTHYGLNHDVDVIEVSINENTLKDLPKITNICYLIRPDHYLLGIFEDKNIYIAIEELFHLFERSYDAAI